MKQSFECKIFLQLPISDLSFFFPFIILLFFSWTNDVFFLRISLITFNSSFLNLLKRFFTASSWKHWAKTVARTWTDIIIKYRFFQTLDRSQIESYRNEIYSRDATSTKMSENCDRVFQPLLSNVVPCFCRLMETKLVLVSVVIETK